MMGKRRYEEGSIEAEQSEGQKVFTLPPCSLFNPNGPAISEPQVSHTKKGNQVSRFNKLLVMTLILQLKMSQSNTAKGKKNSTRTRRSPNLETKRCIFVFVENLENYLNSWRTVKFEHLGIYPISRRFFEKAVYREPNFFLCYAVAWGWAGEWNQ